MNNSLFVVKVSLRHTRPRIWRRLHLPADISLARLHAAIQVSMGWQRVTEHHFEDLQGIIYRSKSVRLGRSRSYNTLANAILGRVGDLIVYHAGFEEDWEHEVGLEAIVPAALPRRAIRCVAGRGQCPPEGSGGPLGFMSLLQDRGGLRLARQRFDPEGFSLSATNAALRRLRS